MSKWTCLLPRWLVGMMLVALLGTAITAGAQAPWPMSGCNAAHNGQSTLSGTPLPTVEWSYGLSEQPSAGQMPVVGADGAVYALGEIGGPLSLLSVAATGALNWDTALPVTPTTSGTPTTAALAPDGTIYAAFDQLYAFDANGNPLWAYAGPNGASTPVIGTNVIYFASGGTLVAVNTNGTKKWSNAVSNVTALTTPALGLNGLIAVGCGKKLIALDTTGTVRGTYTAPAVVGQPVIGGDGTIYFAAGNVLYAVSGLGSLKWSKNLGAAVSTPAVAASGVVICGVGANKVFALSATGGTLWTTTTVSGTISAPAIGANGVIYLTVNAGIAHLYALNPSGSVLWEYVSSYADGETYSAPAIGTGNTVYVLSATTLGTFNGLVAFQAPAGATPQPDLGIYNPANGTYLGANIYNTTGTGQSVTVPFALGVTQTVELLLQNDGVSTTNFRLIATAGNSAWKVRYYIYPEPGIPLDITSAITTIGWTTPPLDPGATLEVYADVLQVSSLPPGSKLNLAVGASSYGVSPKYDLVALTATTPSPTYQPDVILSPSPSSSYLCGANVYNTTGANQTLTAAITPSAEKWYFIRIQNDGNAPTSFYVGTPAATNSSFTYKFINAAGQNLTPCMCNAPYYQTAVVAPGGEVYLTVIIRSSCTLALGQSFSVPICVWAAQDTTARDCAVAAAVAGPCPGVAAPAATGTSATVGLN